MTESPKSAQVHPSSYRDPSGFVFTRGSTLYRQVNTDYRTHYDHLMQSGLFERLMKSGCLISHDECSVDLAFHPRDCYKVILPQKIPFISYPYEWCFSQLKDAALQTLHIQKTAFEYDMILKDASALNIQFLNGKPVHIDTLSFEKYEAGAPWPAYRQFCEHFLGPLVLMSSRDLRMNRMLRSFPNGLPLDLVSSLLPASSWFHPGLLTHLHLHARSQKHFSGQEVRKMSFKMNRLALEELINHLESLIKGLKCKTKKSIWTDYYQDFNYSEEGFQEKKAFFEEALRSVQPQSVWDIGANTGVFSRMAAEKGILTLALEQDPVCVEKIYVENKQKLSTLLPLMIDITDPTPNSGWENREFVSLFERGAPDLVAAFALIHHLAIGHNLSFSKLGRFFSGCAKWLAVEYIDKKDSQVERLLASRKDIFPDYSKEHFEKVMSEYFVIKKTLPLRLSSRTLYLMERRG